MQVNKGARARSETSQRGHGGPAETADQSTQAAAGQEKPDGRAGQSERAGVGQAERGGAAGQGGRTRQAGRRARSLIAATLTCFLFAAAMIMMTPRPVTQIAVAVGYQSDLAKFRRVAPHTVLAPKGLPPDWQPVSSRLTVVPGGSVSYHVGFVTPSGRIAAVEESSERPAEFIRRMTNNGNLLSPVWSAGAWWARRWRPDKDQRSMYRSAPGEFTVVVTGTSDWPELAELAGSLRPFG